MNILARIKEHPYLIGGVVGLVVLFLVFRSSGSSTTTGSVSSSPTDNTLALAQLSAASQTQQYQSAADASAAHDQASLQAAKIGADTQSYLGNLAAEVQLSGIGASADVAKNSNAMNTTIALGQQKEATDLAAIQSNTTIQNTSILTNALLEQSRVAAGVQSQAIGAAQAVQTQSWWSRIFG